MRVQHRSGLGVEGISHAADGADVGGLAVAVELLAQVRYVEVDDVGVDLGGAAPDGVEEDRAGEDLPGALQEGGEQGELLGCQLDALPPRRTSWRTGSSVTSPAERAIRRFFRPRAVA